MIINGPMGVSGVTKISSFTAGFVLILITLFIILNLVHSRTGRAIMSVRDNKIAAESIGISVTRYKLLAFVISAAFAGMAGTLYAMNFSTVTAAKFDFNTSILILVFVVLGGLGNIWGSIIAAALLTVLPELLRAVNDYRMLIYAILLIVMMIFNNSGVKERLMEKRAARRCAELREKGQDVTVEGILADMERRDALDASRAVAPLKQAEDAVLVDTSDLTLEQSIEAVLTVICDKMKGA